MLENVSIEIKATIEVSTSSKILTRRSLDKCEHTC